MIDKEKVIKGLECCTFILSKRKCNECPYQKGPENGCYQLQDDFHALLKDREPVEVLHHEAPYGYPFNTGKCPVCFQELDEGDDFCRSCGQEVKWE